MTQRCDLVRRGRRSPEPGIGDLFGRARTLPQVLSLRQLAVGLVGAPRRGSPAPTVRDGLADLRVRRDIGRDPHARRFRSTRPVAGSAHPDPHPPTPPRSVPTTIAAPPRLEVLSA